MNPLLVDEVIHYLMHRWGKKYDFRLFRRGKFVYFQMMWGFLGQESFPLSEDEYKKSIADKIEILNRCGYSEEVREWLKKVNAKPRLGRLSLAIPLLLLNIHIYLKSQFYQLSIFCIHLHLKEMIPVQETPTSFENKQIFLV